MNGKNRVFLTGDTHGVFTRLKTFCDTIDTSTDDIMIILGDVGLNYYLDKRDDNKKEYLSKLPLTFLCLHGNHEERAWKIDTYQPKFIVTDAFSGTVWVEEKYPNIWFLNDIEEFKLYDKNVLAISGAYSIDKHYRTLMGYKWFPSEQIGRVVMDKYLSDLDKTKTPKFDVVLTHTCPYDYRPIEAFLPNIDQNHVDSRTERFLNDIEHKIDYDDWYCGHFHIDKSVDKIQFLFQSIVQLDC